MSLTIRCTKEQVESIKQAAKNRGFDTIEEYLLTLVEEDEVNFQKALDDIEVGNTIPTSELHEDADSEK